MSRNLPPRLSDTVDPNSRLQCPHAEVGACARCRHPQRFLRRFNSRHVVKDPKRLHEVNRASMVPRRHRS